MKDTKYTIIDSSLYDYNFIEEKLTALAAEGWHLEKVSIPVLDGFRIDIYALVEIQFPILQQINEFIELSKAFFECHLIHIDLIHP